MIFLTKAWKTTSCLHSESKKGELHEKIIPILLPGLFSAAEILAALYLKWQIPAGSAGLSMAADLLLYAWIAYNGCSWTIGYKKIFIHGIWFFQEADVLLTRTAKKTFFCLCIPQAAVSTILFFWFLFSLYHFLSVLPSGKMLLMLSAYRRLFRKTTAKPH